MPVLRSVQGGVHGCGAIGPAGTARACRRPGATIARAGRGSLSVPQPPAGESIPKPRQKVAKPIEQYRAELDDLAKNIEQVPVRTPEEGLGAFLATAALWGLISLVTPCVFPMIPITVSIFLKQAHTARSASG